MLHHIHFNKHEHTNLYLYSGVGNGRPQFAGKMKQTKNGLAPKLAYKLYRSLTVIFVVAECHCLPLVALTDSASQDGNIVSYWRVQQMQAIAFRHATAAHSRLPTIHIRTFILLVSYMPLTNTFSFVFLNFSSSLSLSISARPPFRAAPSPDESRELSMTAFIWPTQKCSPMLYKCSLRIWSHLFSVLPSISVHLTIVFSLLLGSYSRFC